MGWMTAIDRPSLSEALPCPWSAGWELVRQQALPREGMDGRPLGCFSAAAYCTGNDRLWLLSDAPQAYLLPVLGLKSWIGRGVPARIGRRLVLRGTEGSFMPRWMVRASWCTVLQAWIVSEAGSFDRPAQCCACRCETADCCNGRVCRPPGQRQRLVWHGIKALNPSRFERCSR